MSLSKTLPTMKFPNNQDKIRVVFFTSQMFQERTFSDFICFRDPHTNKLKELKFTVIIETGTTSWNHILYDPKKEDFSLETDTGRVKSFVIDKMQNFDNCSCDGYTLLNFGHKC